jgi:hypothetical protein
MAPSDAAGLRTLGSQISQEKLLRPSSGPRRIYLIGDPDE